MGKELIVRGFYPTSSTNSAQKLQCYNLAQEQKARMARVSCEFSTICGTGRNGRNYSYLDEVIDLCLDRNIEKFLLGLTYAAAGNDFDCTDANTLANFSASDRSAQVDARLETIAHVISLGVAEHNIITPLWNEFTRTNNGASSLGVASQTQKDFFNASVVAVKAAFPQVKIGSPIFSIVGNYGWSDVTVGNCRNAGALEPYLAQADYIQGNFYQGIPGEIPIKGVGMVRRVTRRQHEAFEAALDAVDVGGVLGAKEIIYPEASLSFVSAGQRGTNASGGGSGSSLFGYYHGGATQKALCVMAQSTQLLAYPRVAHVGRYQLVNTSSSLDSIDDPGNYGDCLWNDGVTFLRTELHYLVAQARGASVAELEAIADNALQEAA